ncbi:MAG TPA: hypothetical protein VF494_04370 [Candidatus Limnocylindrales bacterium]
MASKRIGILAGGALAGALLLGAAGLVLAGNPTPSPSANPSWGPGMMDGSGMMGGGQMGHGDLTSDQLEKMDAMHDQVIASGTCDPAQMQQLHAPLQSGS